MATAPPVRTTPAGPQQKTARPQQRITTPQTETKTLPEAAIDSSERALVPSGQIADTNAEAAFGPRVLRLPVEVDIVVPVRDFRVRNLLALAPGQLVASHWNSGNDLPLAVGNVNLAWAEFEVLETKLAARITRVA
ncbi:MAG: FliM/FliN family flagellar motor C-terminal domain-containing protein [Terracidiphilus sp.]|jgi:flagellar motor switch protein FliN/FliY